MPLTTTDGLTARGFRVSRSARDCFHLPPALLSPLGNVAFPGIYAARLFARQMNQQRTPAELPAKTARAGDLNAMALIDTVLRFVVRQYRRQCKAAVFAEALTWLEDRLGRDRVESFLQRVCADFPPEAVYRGDLTPEAYLAGESGELSLRQFILEELVMVWLANNNPAYGRYRDLFDDAALDSETPYGAVMTAVQEFFTTQLPFGPEHQTLIEMLRSPALASPLALSGQLEYILDHWGVLLDHFLQRLLSSIDLIAEEEKIVFAGPGPAEVLDYAGLLEETERFSRDRDWMPQLVLMAKNIHVWMDQLAKQYQRPVDSLDDIPDEALNILARRGFTGLWLIGLWERSRASRRIKHYCGNPEAVASAYSLKDYRAADDLGGDAALERLRARAWQRGIRLASDMVPNHMGIDSNWVLEHPDWFVSVRESPFPVYRFNGPDLSDDERVGIFIDDQYYDHSDAAVVFKRVDRLTGDTQYIYHGNDGTSMPWNDTAQLNYLLPRVREAVIQTILHVARQFPIIRFDAAMTLAKKHYQRLWFPEPGTGGAIPSRAEHSISRHEFDTLFPVEFWREVVDRIAQEEPDTLLLAEAFWLMEGYFVRTLGMHRVYNSAFMNMLRDEDNAKYRSVLKNTMEFDPEILQRFVNFMNNPDERTAVEQFGTGDKYFGICTVMVTLPGLPMFGHGQIEGYAEKYGMEYCRAYWNEEPDAWLVARHQREIFPLLHRRYLFAEARDFLLYDFVTADGQVNEDVLAYSNRAGQERALVIYHNRFASTAGWIRLSAASLHKEGDGRVLQQRMLGDGLGVRNEEESYLLFRDHASGLEYIRPAADIHARGLYVELQAYQYHVFLDFREVRDTREQVYRQVCDTLAGGGVPSIDEAIRELSLRPVHQPFHELVNAGFFHFLIDACRGTDKPTFLRAGDEVEERALRLLSAMDIYRGVSGDAAAVARAMRQRLVAMRNIGVPSGSLILTWGIALGWLATHALGQLHLPDRDAPDQSRARIDEWMLETILTATLQEMELEAASAAHAVGLVKILVQEQLWAQDAGDGESLACTVLSRWLQNDDVQRQLQINRYDNTVWFNREGFEELLAWAEWVARVMQVAGEDRPPGADDRLPAQIRTALQAWRQAENHSEYRVDTLLQAVCPAQDEGIEA